ncbi:MAG: hypothetical protein AAB733_00465 [Patescibacteria group bacterium]
MILAPRSVLFVLIGINRTGALGTLPTEWVFYRVSWDPDTARPWITETAFELTTHGCLIRLAGGFTLVINPEKATAEICHERFPRNRVVLIGSLEEILNRILRIEGTYGVGSIGEQLFLWVLLDDREEISHLKYGLRQSEEALADERLWARVLEGAVDRAVVHVHDHVRVCAAGRRLTLLDAYLQNFWAQDPGSMIARGASLDRILVPPMHTLSPSEAELERIFSIQRARRVSEKWNPVAAGV